MKTTDFINENTAGAFKGTALAEEDIWKEVVKRKSRKEKVTLITGNSKHFFRIKNLKILPG